MATESVGASISFQAVTTQSENHNMRIGHHAQKEHFIRSRKSLNEKVEDYSVPEKTKQIKQLYKDKFISRDKEERLTKKGKDGNLIIPKKRQKVRKLQKNSKPIRECVINLQSNHTMDDLKKACDKVAKKLGVTPFQWHIHRDEGKVYASKAKIPPEILAKRKVVEIEEGGFCVVNYHAHVVWDWQDKKTGRMQKTKPVQFKEIQTIIADSLGMERGKSGGQKRLETADFKEFHQRKEDLENEIIELDTVLQKKKVEIKLVDCCGNSVDGIGLDSRSVLYQSILQTETLEKKNQDLRIDCENLEGNLSNLNLMGSAEQQAKKKQRQEKELKRLEAKLKKAKTTEKDTLKLLNRILKIISNKGNEYKNTLKMIFNINGCLNLIDVRKFDVMLSDKKREIKRGNNGLRIS